MEIIYVLVRSHLLNYFSMMMGFFYSWLQEALSATHIIWGLAPIKENSVSVFRIKFSKNSRYCRLSQFLSKSSENQGLWNTLIRDHRLRGKGGYSGCLISTLKLIKVHSRSHSKFEYFDPRGRILLSLIIKSRLL